MTIRMSSWVDAPVERCFLLATNKNVASMDAAAPGGVLTEGETLAWRLQVLGVGLRLVSKIDAYRRPSHFRDALAEGIFRSYEHDHHFAAMDDGTRVRDEIRFEVRFGVLGSVLGQMFLKPALRKMLAGQQERIKRIAESGEWQQYVKAAEESAQETVLLAAGSRQIAPMQGFAR